LKIQRKTIDLCVEDLANKRNFSNLSAQEDQRVQIGRGVSILVVKIRGKQVRLGIDFPSDIEFLRGELYEKGKSEKRQL
jgi:carbon storage regulator CsrA